MSQIEVADRAALPLKTLGKFRWPQTVLPRLLWFNLRPPSLCPVSVWSPPRRLFLKFSLFHKHAGHVRFRARPHPDDLTLTRSHV